MLCFRNGIVDVFGQHCVIACVEITGANSTSDLPLISTLKNYLEYQMDIASFQYDDQYDVDISLKASSIQKITGKKKIYLLLGILKMEQFNMFKIERVHCRFIKLICEQFLLLSAHPESTSQKN